MSDRHEKWVKAFHGDHIPAGQPYRHEYKGGSNCVSAEYVNKQETVRVEMSSQHDPKWFVDSTWRPPLPTAPGSVIEAKAAGPHPRRVVAIRLTGDCDYNWASADGAHFNDDWLTLVRIIHDAGPDHA